MVQQICSCYGSCQRLRCNWCEPQGDLCACLHFLSINPCYILCSGSTTFWIAKLSALWILGMAIVASGKSALWSCVTQCVNLHAWVCHRFINCRTMQVRLAQDQMAKVIARHSKEVIVDSFISSSRYFCFTHFIYTNWLDRDIRHLFTLYFCAEPIRLVSVRKI